MRATATSTRSSGATTRPPAHAARRPTRRSLAVRTPAFLGVPIPIKDLTPVAGWPVTYGSNGGPDASRRGRARSRRRSSARASCSAGRTNTPEFGPITVTENDALRHHAQPVGPRAHAGRLERRRGGGGRLRDVPARARERRRRLDPHPRPCCGLVGLKPSRGRVPRRAQSWLGRRRRGRVTRTVADTAAVLDVLAGPTPLWYNAPPPDRPFLEESAREAAGCAIGLMDTGPSGLPVDPTAPRPPAAPRTRSRSSATRSCPPTSRRSPRSSIAPFLVVINASLADYEGIDWTKVEPHIKAARRSRPRRRRASTTRPRRRRSSAFGRDLVSSWGADFDVLVTPRMAILPPPAGAVLPMAHAAEARRSRRCSPWSPSRSSPTSPACRRISLPVHRPTTASRSAPSSSARRSARRS